MGSIKHHKTSTIPNALNDTQRIGGDDWNNEHDIDLAVEDIEGLEARLIPVDQVVQYRDDALQYRNEAGTFRNEAEGFANDAAESVASLSADDGTTLVKGTWFGGVLGYVSDLATSAGASLIGFIQASADAVARSIRDKLREKVTFDDFGAIGDRVADDTEAIRKAMIFMATNKRDVYGVAGKIYRITGEINVPKGYTGVQRGYRTVDGGGCGIFIDGNITCFSYTPAYTPPSSAPLLEKANYLINFRGINFEATPGSGAIAFRTGGFITTNYDDLNFIGVDYPFWQENGDPRATPDYVQSLKISRVYSNQHQTFFEAKRVYNSSITQFDIDAGVNGVHIDWGNTGQSGYGFRMLDGMVQSQSGIGIALGGIQGLVLDEIYWENCGREFVAIHSGTVVNYGGRITGQFVQPKASPPPERLAAFDLGGCSSSGFKLGGNVSQDQKLYNWNAALSLGYFDTTNDRSAVTSAALWDPVTRPSAVRAILSIAHRWGLLWATSGGMFLNPVSRGIEYTHSEYDYVDPVDNVRIPILRGVAVIAPAGFGGGLDGLGVSPQQAPSLYSQKAFAAGSFLGNPTPSATANASNIVFGYGDVTSGRPGTWVECRALTKRGTDILNIDGPNSRVGINTALPTVPFQVTGTSRFYGNGGFSIGWGDSSDLGRLSQTGGVPSISGLTNGLNLNTTASVPITITTNSVERARWDGAGNLLIGGVATPTSARAALVIANGVAPTASVADGVALYAEDVASSSELKVRDEAGNITTLSPHNFSLIPQGQSEDMAWAYYSEKGGKRINVDMLRLARLVERVTGEKLVYEDES